MITLYLKEIKLFFNSLTAYIVVIVFLVINSLFMFVFPGEFNILDAGYANIDTLFIISPWVFLFLVPAITMRLFSDEKRTGTIELLLTRPLSDLNIVLSKYLAGLSLVLLSLLPSLVYYFSVYSLGNPVGNLDTGGIIGSYIGLFFLASIYVAIGLFCSSLTENQIIAFIITVIITFFFYVGFESISTVDVFYGMENVIKKIGINSHYVSMSRGVIDTRDVIYFLSISSLFIYFSKLKLESRKIK